MFVCVSSISSETTGPISTNDVLKWLLVIEKGLAREKHLYRMYQKTFVRGVQKNIFFEKAGRKKMVAFRKLEKKVYLRFFGEKKIYL